MIGDHLRTFVHIEHPAWVLPTGFVARGWEVGTWNGFPVIALDGTQYRALIDHLDTLGVEDGSPLYEGTPSPVLMGVWHCDGLQWAAAA